MPMIYQKFWHLFLELFCAKVGPKVRYAIDDLTILLLLLPTIIEI